MITDLDLVIDMTFIALALAGRYPEQVTPLVLEFV